MVNDFIIVCDRNHNADFGSQPYYLAADLADTFIRKIPVPLQSQWMSADNRYL